MNNLASLLQKRLHIKLAGETIYDCDEENHYRIYCDLRKLNSIKN